MYRIKKIILPILRVLNYNQIRIKSIRKRLELKNNLLIKKPDIETTDYTNILSAIQLPTSPFPKASIIICAYNKLNYTLNCLYSLSRFQNKTPFEIIFIDDCSTDKTENMLYNLNGLKYFRNQTNLGFLHSCNRGADESSGKYIVFLNNDTIVCDHWLDCLIDHMESHKDVCLTGSKLIYPNYILQEAGGYVFSDGNAINCGRGDHPDKMHYNYCKEVDYCSGASIAISKDIFFSLGKFSEIFAPCYYEDTDLALKVRQAGFKVCYVPLSCVIHFEGISCGTDIRGGYKKYQEINRIKFQKKWENVLSHYHKKQDLSSNKWLIPHIYRKKILILGKNIPTPDTDAHSNQIWQILNILSEKYHITFWPLNASIDSGYSHQLSSMGIELLNTSFPRFFLWKNGRYFDYVFLFHTDITDNRVSMVNKCCPNAKIIYDIISVYDHILYNRDIATYKA